MKKILSAIVFLPILLAGCVNLDFVESDALTSAALATNPAAAIYTTDGIYSMMKDMSTYQNSQNNSFVRQYFLLNELKTDNICFSNTSTDPFWKAAQFIETASDANVSFMWFICYKMIYAANSNISGLTEDDAQSRQLKGENYFLRAFFHFTLLTLYAKPYSFDNGASPGIVLRMGDYSTTVRSSVADCYTAIEEDLKEACRLLTPGTKRGDNGYATYEAAKALQSRVYLYKGDWDACIEAANDILGDNPASHLENEVTTLFSNAPTSKEVIWCVDITDTDIANMPPKGNLASMYDSPDGTQNTGWGELYVADPLQDLFERFPGKDKRYTDIVRLHNSKTGLLVYWAEMDEGALKPVIAYPDITFVRAKDEKGQDAVDKDGKPIYEVQSIESCVTDNGDGTYSFPYNKKTLKAIPDNTSSKYCNDFPGYILNDGKNTRCYVRRVIPATAAVTLDKNNDPVAVWDGSGGSIRGAGGQFLCWFSEKFSHQTGITYPISSSFIMLRYAEVILNRAEAYAHKGGNDDKAIADVNVIRTRAGLTGAAQMSSANMAGRGYASAVDMVLDERRMEFYYEGLRLQDLLRNKKDIDRHFLNFIKAETIPYNSPKVQYPIPQDEVQVSGILPNER